MSHSYLNVDEGIAKLFTGLLQPVDGAQVFTNRIDHCEPVLRRCIEMNCRVTAVGTDNFHGRDRGRILNLFGESSLHYTHLNTPEWLRPLDQFHMAFGVYPFTFTEDDKAEALECEDKMMHWKVSQGREHRIAPLHLVGLEGLMRATQVGGYFGAVLPKRWVGRNTAYLKWWQDRAALVARIKLPEGAVMKANKIIRYLPLPWEENEPGENFHFDMRDFTRESWQYDAPAPGDWELMIWHRPLLFEEGATAGAIANGADKIMPHAKFRFTPFIYQLETTGTRELNTCIQSFQQNEWYRQSVKLWTKALREYSSNDWCGTYRTKPRGVPSVEDMFFFEPTPDHQFQIRQLETADEIKQVPMAVQIKVGSKIRLSCYTPEASAILLELRHDSQFHNLPDGSWMWKLDEQLARQNFSELKEELVQKLENWGLVPCMTKNDYHAFTVRDRWLSRQLTPIERMVPVVKATSSDLMSSEEKAWEMAYTDTGMMSTYPEIMAQWAARGRKIGLDKMQWSYQFEDSLYHVAKDGLLNGNVMGLGKTMTALGAAILRGVKRVLIVCPTKLVDVWRDEIIANIAPFMRRARRNWNGQIFDSTVNVINWAKDCQEENLRFFNIISYDKLKSVPRDVRFYRCPKCGVLACKKSQRDDTAPVCPGNPAQPEHERCSHVVKMWKEECAGDDNTAPKRKFKAKCNPDGSMMLHPNGVPQMVHWNSKPEDFPGESIKVFDTRPPRPELPRMELLDNICKKVTMRKVGTEIDPNTQEEKAVYKGFERNPHIAWTFSDIIRWKFPLIIADEALYFMNEDSQRSQALFHLCANTRWSLTGTPIKGYPQRILPILNWTFKRSVFPDYRNYDSGGMKRFMDKYRTEVTIVREGKGLITESGEVIGGTKKQVPKINNPELFQAELAPLMRRHVRTEPEIVKVVPRKIVKTENVTVEMDAEHRDYYKKWLQKFAEWWQKMKEEEEGKKVAPGQLLVKLTYLANASSIPHTMLNGILSGKDDTAKQWALEIGRYRGPVTAKMKKSWQLIVQAAKQGDKVLSFSWRQANQDIGMVWAKKAKLNAMYVDGRVSIKPRAGMIRGHRHEMVEAFRHQNYHVMFAGLEALAEGMNIPEANWGIIQDCGWEPALPRQAIGRMIRPQQTKPIYAYYLMHHGTIDDYMMALCHLKGRASDEGIDYMDFDDFSTEMIPDIHQYADCIVDGTEEKVKAKMWTAIEHNRKVAEEEGDE